MRIDLITLFPELIEPFLRSGITRRAFETRQLDVRLWPLRDFAQGNYRRVDDRPYGGGPGMVLLAEPLERALAAVAADRGEQGAQPACIHFSPAGQPITQVLLRAWAACAHVTRGASPLAAQHCASPAGAILLCGRYEGVDERVVQRHVTLTLSLGDFVLSGGELPALAFLDGVARLLPGVLADERSHEQDSFENGLLDCPHYSRPEVLQRSDGSQAEVPAVLLGGNHAEIARWRREQSLAITARQRPDLIAAARLAGALSAADERVLAALVAPARAHTPEGNSPTQP